jgi:YVTN family beta-propeller protein
LCLGDCGANGSAVDVIDTQANTVVATVPVGSPVGVAITPDGTDTYIANTTPLVSVINTASNSIAATVSTFGTGLYEIAITPDGQSAYVTTFGGSVFVINIPTNTVVATIPVGAQATGIATAVITDAMPPVITPSVSGTACANGWYTSPVSVSWSVSDPESGISSSSDCNTTTLVSYTPDVTLTCSVTNGAGLSSSVPVSVKVATPITLFSMGPQAMEGNLTLSARSMLQVGYDFTMPGNHPTANLRFIGARVTFSWSCVSGPGSGVLVVPMADQSYTDAQSSPAWYPGGDQQSSLVYQGSIVVPDKAW